MHGVFGEIVSPGGLQVALVNCMMRKDAFATGDAMTYDVVGGLVVPEQELIGVIVFVVV